MQKSKVKPFYFLTFAVLLILYTSNVSAQYYSDEPTFFGGFIIGANFAQVDGDNFAGYRKIGLNGGAIVHTRLFEQATISMELLYSEKGSIAGKNQLPAVYGNSGTLITEYDILLRTAEIPVNFNYFFSDQKSILYAGFSYAQLVDARASLNGTPTDDLYPFKKYDVALNLGGSYKLWKKLYLNFRFQNSLLNIREKHDPRVERSQQTNRSISLRLMYLFKPE